MPPKTPKATKTPGAKPSAPRAIKKNSTSPSDASNDDDVNPSENGVVSPPARKGPSMQMKAIKAREKAIADKVTVVTSTVNTALGKDDGIVVDCFHYAPSMNAPLDKNTLDYVHLMKLSSPMPFVLVKQTKLDEGPYAGHVAVLFKQSLPFPFMKLPVSVRAKVYNFLLKHDEDAIPMTLTQSSKKTAYCPSYKGKNTLAILGTCKELRAEIAPFVYGQKFHFPGTQVISMFLLQIGQFRKFLVSIHSDTYNASSARTMFHLLHEAPALHRLSFSHVTSNEKPNTAVKNFYGDALPWLTIVGQVHPTQALRILKFDAAAFHRREKDEHGNSSVVQWDNGEQMLFWKGLKAKLEALGRRT